MHRPIAVLGAASSIGIRPYDDGRVRHLDRAPQALREQDLAARLGACDHGDLRPPPYRDFSRPGSRPRNETEVVQYSHELGRAVAEAGRDGAFVLVLGGDCSVLLGSLLGVGAQGRRVGVVYIDAHADFATPEESVTGSVAAMAPAFAVGRGDSPLSRLGGDGALVRAQDLVMIGRRDQADGDIYGQAVLEALRVLDLSHEVLRLIGAKATAAAALQRFQGSGLERFWIHLDADVLDPSVLPAVDSPEPNGLTVDEVIQLLRPLAGHPGALGMQLTIYDPHLDPDRRCAATLASLLERSLNGR